MTANEAGQYGKSTTRFTLSKRQEITGQSAGQMTLGYLRTLVAECEDWPTDSLLFTEDADTITPILPVSVLRIAHPENTL